MVKVSTVKSNLSYSSEILEEHSVQVIVIVQTCMCQQAVKILSALVNHCRKADDLGSCTDYYQQLRFSVTLKMINVLHTLVID